MREPVIDGGRLRLNSLTGAYSAANMMHAFGIERFCYVFGAPQEEHTEHKLRAYIRAAQVKFALSNLRVASIGHTPEGFGFGRALDSEMLVHFGVRVCSVEARELINRGKSYTDASCEEYLNRIIHSTVGMDRIPAKNQMDCARLYRAYSEFVQENQIDALSSRCWPDFFTEFGTPVCTVLAMLNDSGIPSACEADSFGSLSMFVGMKLSDMPTFFGDPVSLDDNENTITYWHCGTAACSLADPATGAQIGVHCNRKIGPTMDFGCKKCDAVTVFRIGRTPAGTFRLFLTSGKALERPKQFNGTSIVVQTDGSARAIVENSVRDGWEPHFVVIFADVKEELKAFGEMMNMDIFEY